MTVGAQGLVGRRSPPEHPGPWPPAYSPATSDACGCTGRSRHCSELRFTSQCELSEEARVAQRVVEL